FFQRNKAPYEPAIPLLLPQHHMVIPHYMGIDSESELGDNNINGYTRGIKRNDSFSTRSSFQDIPLLMPQEADGQVSESGDFKLNGLYISNDHPSWGFPKSSNSESSPQDMPMRGFVDDADSLKFSAQFLQQRGLQFSGKEWWEAQERGDQVVTADEMRQVGPRVLCHCQVIRSVSQWSAGTSQVEESIHAAYRSLIEKAEHFVYIENQFFISGLSDDEVIQNRVLESLYQRIKRAHEEDKTFRVIVVVPLLPGFQGGVDDSGAASVRAIMHWQYRTICRGPYSILHNLYNLVGPKMHDYISFYGLRAYGRLFDGGPVATSQV
ncbi:hypothetical protein M569_12584, partial [Genlisea aurea]